MVTFQQHERKTMTAWNRGVTRASDSEPLPKKRPLKRDPSAVPLVVHAFMGYVLCFAIVIVFAICVEVMEVFMWLQFSVLLSKGTWTKATV